MLTPMLLEWNQVEVLVLYGRLDKVAQDAIGHYASAANEGDQRRLLPWALDMEAEGRVWNGAEWVLPEPSTGLPVADTPDWPDMGDLEGVAPIGAPSPGVEVVPGVPVVLDRSQWDELLAAAQVNPNSGFSVLLNGVRRNAAIAFLANDMGPSLQASHAAAVQALHRIKAALDAGGAETMQVSAIRRHLNEYDEAAQAGFAPQTREPLAEDPAPPGAPGELADQVEATGDDVPDVSADGGEE